MSKRVDRRRFLAGSVRAAAGAAGVLALPAVFPRSIFGANEKLHVAGIGVGGKGESDIGYCASENVVALCDVDDRRAAESFQRFPAAQRFKDYRKMLETAGKTIDAVTVSTPDHVHAPAAIQAMRMGKHVYCQKPLTHCVHEARRLAEVAREMKVATQMGNQGHSHSMSRRLTELIRAGVLGRVTEVHVWTDRPIWPQGIDRPSEAQEVPAHLDWDLWLGPAPVRRYHEAYVPFNWRGFWDFGTGALGDMGCHNMDLAFFALDLRDPTSVEATCSGIHADTAPAWSVITYRFPARGELPPVTLTWYDGGKQPAQEIARGRKLEKNGYILAGDKDSLLVSHYWGGGTFLSGAKLEDFSSIPETLPRRPESDGEDSVDRKHRLEWLEACKGGPKALSNFDYSGPMTEAILLGNVALRAGKRIEWDAKSLTVTNLPEANRYIRKEYRKGWEI